MIGFIASFTLSFGAYLFLAASQGEVLGLWSQHEMIAAVIVSLIVAVISTRVLFQKKTLPSVKHIKVGYFFVLFDWPFFLCHGKSKYRCCLSGNYR